MAGSTYHADGGDRIELSDIKLHPNYRPSTDDCDAALLKLNRKPMFGKYSIAVSHYEGFYHYISYANCAYLYLAKIYYYYPS